MKTVQKIKLSNYSDLNHYFKYKFPNYLKWIILQQNKIELFTNLIFFEII